MNALHWHAPDTPLRASVIRASALGFGVVIGLALAARPWLQLGPSYPAKVAAGKKKTDEVLCPMCHLGEFAGQNEIPRVAGQHYQYVKKQLADFKARRRTNDAGNMTSVASTLSDEDIENLAQYATSLY